MGQPVIRAERLSRDFGGKRALDRVNLSIGSGQVVALLGPNGAGKSTLLRLLSGALEPTEGSAYLFGERSRRLAPETLTRVSVMLDGQEPPRWATPKRLLDLQSEASPSFDRSLCERFLCSHDLQPGTSYESMSKGQKRWTLAALCLASSADLLLLDEPAEGLDPAARRELYDRIRDYANDRGGTIFVATHLIHDIERIADEVAILERGRLLLHETLEVLRERAREVEFPTAVEASNLDGELDWLGTKQERGGMVGWILIPDEGEEALRHRLAPEVEIRPVGLESLYFAVTAYSKEEVETDALQ